MIDQKNNVVALNFFLIFRGLRKLIAKNFKYGTQEVFKGAILAAQVKELQKYVPDIELSDIERLAMAGRVKEFLLR